MKESWLFPKTPSEAVHAQKEMEQKVVIEKVQQPIRYIAGADISCNPFDPKQLVFASIVVLSYPSLEILETANHKMKQTFPYIPGLLGFREVPILVETFQQLTIRPDLIMVDGHGISHPRRFEVATHLGVVLDLPTIGVAIHRVIQKLEFGKEGA